MSEFPARKPEYKKDWALTSRAFHRLLNWLDKGDNSDGRNYLEMRRRLMAYFDRKNCLAPDDLADETLNRVARRLEEEGITEAETPAKYCYIVARFVFMEYLRGRKADSLLEDSREKFREQEFNPEATDDEGLKEKTMNCLERCLARLEPSNRDMIIRYYVGKERVKIENRRALAESLGITVNALSIRACRLRDKLEACVENCLAK